MSHRILALVAVALAAWAAPAAAQQMRAEQETRLMLKLLQEPIDTRVFTSRISLQDALGLIYEQLTARKLELPILVDVPAYRTPDPTTEVDATLVRLPAAPRQMTVEQALQFLLSQLPEPSTYLIRPGPRLDIMPARLATVQQLLQRPIVAAFDQVPLRDALTELAYQSGATINLDGRAAEKLKLPVSATFRNVAPLQDAIQVLTDQAGLKAAVLQNSIYVTTPDNATQLERESLLRPRSVEVLPTPLAPRPGRPSGEAASHDAPAGLTR